MLLLEHDAKTILAERRIPVPDGYLTDAATPKLPAGSGPWMVKAQVPAGGRGKAGGIIKADSPEDVLAAAKQIAVLKISGHPVHALRIELAQSGGREVYLGFSVDAARADVAVMVSASGGVDVEGHAADAMHTAHARPETDALVAAVDDLLQHLPAELRGPLAEAGRLLAAAFVELEATLLEINPLFVLPDGSWVAGDARMTVDESALPRQPVLARLLDDRSAAYADAAFKRRQGFDLVVVDPDGEIGLVTTGAGLSMKLIDEMTARGARPYNFCDIRSGQMRGDPARLVEALKRISQGPRVRCVLVNIFAGITDLGEFAALLVAALKALPDMKLPMVVRLVGNGEQRAQELLEQAGLSVVIERDLEAAVALCTGLAENAHA